MEIIHLSNENYNDVVAKSPAIIVDFWATWCVPCQQFAPIFEKASEENEKVLFAKVDVDSNKEIAMENGVSSIPTLAAYKNGELIYKGAGGKTLKELAELVEKLL